MASVSGLASLGFPISRVEPYSTSTARLFVRTSDTGTVAITGRQIDLGQTLHVGATGGKPLDTTVHARAGGPPRWRSAAVAVPFELVYHTSGVNTYVTVTHQCRSATSGAGSTYRTLETDVFRFKMGTDTDATFHKGLVSDCSLQAADRYYRANLSVAFRTASSTAAKDTSTNQEMVINSPVYLFGAESTPQITVPYKVS